MSTWHIRGETRLEGSIPIQGSKNAALPIMAASVLAPCETELINVPRLRDVETTRKILTAVGCSVSMDGDSVGIDSRGGIEPQVPCDLMREMRPSVIFMGALLARCGEAKLCMPGGCELGPRPIDLHLMALEKLGAEIQVTDGEITARAKKLHGAVIDFATPSVGATENAMLAACGAEGVTVIHNAAKEPEIEDLQNYLVTMGARISGAGTDTIRVEGFSPGTVVGHRIIPDRIAAATYLCMAAAAGGDVELRGVVPDHFDPVICTLAESGCAVAAGSGCVRIRSKGRLHAPEIVTTGPYPEFPTDAQPLLLAACLKAHGSSVFVENVFSDRFKYIDQLRRLGAVVHTEGRVAVVTGVKKLTGTETVATDLRGGAALVTAALTAEGETLIRDTGHIARGYENLCGNLRALGAEADLTD